MHLFERGERLAEPAGHHLAALLSNLGMAVSPSTTAPAPTDALGARWPHTEEHSRWRRRRSTSRPCSATSAWSSSVDSSRWAMTGHPYGTKIIGVAKWPHGLLGAVIVLSVRVRALIQVVELLGLS